MLIPTVVVYHKTVWFPRSPSAVTNISITCESLRLAKSRIQYGQQLCGLVAKVLELFNRIYASSESTVCCQLSDACLQQIQLQIADRTGRWWKLALHNFEVIDHTPTCEIIPRHQSMHAWYPIIKHYAIYVHGSGSESEWYPIIKQYAMSMVQLISLSDIQ